MLIKRILVILFLLLVVGMGIWPFLPENTRTVIGQEKTQFAADRAQEEVHPVNFDGLRALEYLKSICDLGPRQSGTPAMKKQQALIEAHFTKLGQKVHRQEFEAKQVSQKVSVEMTNLIISYKPELKKRIILCSHYDTRPVADQEVDVRKWREPFVSANDGGSGVAFLMEMAHYMKDLPTKVGVDFVLFDGEEYVFERNRDKYFFGSEHFAKEWKKSKDRPDYRGAILLDMIAGKQARFPAEGYSFQRAPELCREIWKLASELNCDRFANEVSDHVQDDHLALLNVGIPAIDIIDFRYPHWHRLTDVPANCHHEPLEQVAKVLSVWMQRVK